jgi:probable HAF family extracellular repeat protein
MTPLRPMVSAVTRSRALAAIATAAILTALTVATAAVSATTSPAAKGSDWPRNRSGADTAPRSLVPGFLLDRGSFTAFDAPDARVETLPYDVNDRGRIVGRYFDGAAEQAFMRDRAGRFTTIRIPGAQSAWASGINNRGQVVGIYSENTANVKDPGAKQHGFLWDRGRVTRIDVPGAASTGAFGINDRRQVVGEYENPRGTGHGFLWSKGRFSTIDRPGAAGTVPYGINNSGQIVGGSFDTDDLAAGRIHGFLLDKGRYTIFDAPGVPVTLPYGINNRGRITGFTLTPTEADPVAGGRGFLLRKGVKGRFTPIDFPGAPRTFVTGLNDHGQIVGGYENPDAGLGSPGTGAP